MKILLCLASIVLMSFTPVHKTPIERIGVKGPLEFNKTDYMLAWSQRPNVDYYVQEYLPRNETVEQFNQMLTMHVFVKDVSVEDAVLQKEAELIQRKATDKVCNYSISQSPDGKEKLVDCVLSTEKYGQLTIVEFIIYRYRQIELENHKKGLLIFSYSKRSYGTDILPFFTKLATDRKNLLNLMIAKELPKIKIKE